MRAQQHQLSFTKTNIVPAMVEYPSIKETSQLIGSKLITSDPMPLLELASPLDMFASLNHIVAANTTI